MSAMLLEEHGGQVPAEMDALVKLPGVGRKTANVVLGHALGVPGLPVDRHVCECESHRTRQERRPGESGGTTYRGAATRAMDAGVRCVDPSRPPHLRPKPLCQRCNVRPYCDFYRLGFTTKPTKKTLEKAIRKAGHPSLGRLRERSLPRSGRAPRKGGARDARRVPRAGRRGDRHDPSKFAREIRNVAIVIQDEPSEDLLAEMEMDPEQDVLLGLYQGTPLPDRGWGYGNNCPTASPFPDPIEDDCRGDEDEIIIAIGETLIHELGHYFGLGEDEIMEIEERYWRGEPDPADVEEDKSKE